MLVLRRGYSAPERATLAAACAGAAGLVYPAVMAHTGGQGLPCPWRALTGIPCPFCGMTTATVALTHGRWPAAAAASPLVYLVAVMVAVTFPVLLARAAGWLPPPRPWSAAARRRAEWALLAVACLSWLYQLHRFGDL